MKQNQIQNLQALAFQALLPGLRMALQIVSEQIDTIEGILSASIPTAIPLAGSQRINGLESRPESKDYHQTEEYREKVSQARKKAWAEMPSAQRKAQLKKMADAKQRQRQAAKATIKLTKNRTFLLRYMQQHDGKLMISELRQNRENIADRPTSPSFYETTVYDALTPLVGNKLCRKIGAGAYELTDKGAALELPA